MNNIAKLVKQEQKWKGIFRVGDTIKVDYLIKDGDKTRVQVFQGDVLGMTASNFTVRKISSGISVEKKIPFHSVHVSDIKVLKKGKVRRAKLFCYLRDAIGKAARIKTQ